MTLRPPALLALSDEAAGRLFDGRASAQLATLIERLEVVWAGTFDGDEARHALAKAEILVTAWGAPALDERVLAGAPNLRAVFHTGGTVRRVVTPACWDRDLVVVSAAEANAIPVAEFTLASVIYAGKRVPEISREFTGTHGGSWYPAEALAAASNYRRTIGLVGLSRIGRRVARLLRLLDVEVLAADPYATPALAAQLGVRLVELDDLVRGSDVVSLHAPALPQTLHMMNAHRLALMRDGATLINTARGSLVDTAALTRELASGRLSAILDVTDPEPLPPDSPLFDLPNVQLTPHLAGSTGTEVTRMGDLVIAELDRYLRGEPLQHRVLQKDMDHVA